MFQWFKVLQVDPSLKLTSVTVLTNIGCFLKQFFVKQICGY